MGDMKRVVERVEENFNGFKRDGVVIKGRRIVCREKEKVVFKVIVIWGEGDRRVVNMNGVSRWEISMMGLILEDIV